MAQLKKKKAAKSAARPAAKPVKKASARQPNAPADGDWRTQTLAQVRALIEQADPDVVEEIKWRKPSNGMQGVKVWSHDGILCTGETYKDKVKLTFANGASLADPQRLFNSSLDGGTRRAIDLRQGEAIDAAAFEALIRAAVEFNRS